VEYRSDGTIARNLYGKGIDEILMRTEAGINRNQPFYYQQDHEGNVTHLTNTIKENGKVLYTGRANVNGFMKDDRGNQTRGIPKGDYTLQPKQEDGVYPKGQPAITGPGLKPGQPTRDYKLDSVLVHEKDSSGKPDSKACVTCDREAVDLTKQVMDRNLD
jgi:hypothetical protein